LKETRPLWPPQRGVGLQEPNLGKTNPRVTLFICLRFVFHPLSRTCFLITNANPACSCVYICKFQFCPIHPPSRRLSLFIVHRSFIRTIHHHYSPLLCTVTIHHCYYSLLLFIVTIYRSSDHPKFQLLILSSPPKTSQTHIPVIRTLVTVIFLPVGNFPSGHPSQVSPS
jgi:hypothetical protein